MERERGRWRGGGAKKEGKVTPLQETEMGVLRQLRQAEKEAAGQLDDEKINAWDMSCYQNIVEKKN